MKMVKWTRAKIEKEMAKALENYRSAKTTADKTMYRKKRQYLKHKLKTHFEYI